MLDALEAMLFRMGFKGQKSDKNCLQLNPPTSKVNVTIRDYASSREPQVIRPSKTGMIDMDSFQNGKFEVNIWTRRLKPKKLLQSFVLEKSESGLDVLGVDTGATVVEAIFKNGGDEFPDALVLGTFLDVDNKPYELKGRTNANGAYNFVLPAGTVKDLRAVSCDGSITVPKRGKMNIPSRDPTDALVKHRCFTIELDAKSFSSSVDTSRKAVILGDVSGSMSSGGLIAILQRSFNEIAEKAFKKDCQIALGTWNSWTEWCSPAWLSSSDQGTVQSFVQDIKAGGGNDMRYAIEDSIRKFPDVEDIYVMCDGDISPFSLNGTSSTSWSDVPKPSNPSNESRGSSYSNTSWQGFRGRYPSVSFHFVALGRASEAESMTTMAEIGGGTFWEST